MLDNFKPGSLVEDLRNLLNRHSVESQSGTPDYILANYCLACLDAFSAATRVRDSWHGFNSSIVTHHIEDDGLTY